MKAPPYSITETVLNLSIKIAESLGAIGVLQITKPDVGLRRENQIKTIHSSLAIEGNTLTVEQITDIINGKRVLGPTKDIKEVRNAIKVYNSIHKFNYCSSKSLLSAHKQLMLGLVSGAGIYRNNNVGIFAGNSVAHVAPPANRVPKLMHDLLSYLAKDDGSSLLIKSCVFHYELEFIHPFMDGNGRMGRLWQQVILMHYHPIFEFLPIENLIKDNQEKYYKVLNQCDKLGESTKFLEFSLSLISQSLETFKQSIISVSHTPEERMTFAASKFANNWFDRKTYMVLHKTISSATASRDIKNAVDQGKLEIRGAKRMSQYRFKNEIKS